MHSKTCGYDRLQVQEEIVWDLVSVASLVCRKLSSLSSLRAGCASLWHCVVCVAVLPFLPTSNIIRLHTTLSSCIVKQILFFLSPHEMKEEIETKHFEHTLRF